MTWAVFATMLVLVGIAILLARRPTPSPAGSPAVVPALPSTPAVFDGVLAPHRSIAYPFTAERAGRISAAVTPTIFVLELWTGSPQRPQTLVAAAITGHLDVEMPGGEGHVRILHDGTVDATYRLVVGRP